MTVEKNSYRNAATMLEMFASFLNAFASVLITFLFSFF